MKTSNVIRRMLSLGLGAGLILALNVAANPQQAVAWEPKKPVEIVVISAKGGGADDMARLIQGALAKHKLSSKPFTVVNKSGGTGAEALLYVNDKKGDNHTLLVAQNKFYTTPLNNPKLGIDISTFTPIGRMAVDTFVLWVHADTKIKTLADYVKAAKAAGPKWVMAGSGKQSEDEMLTEFLKSNYGLPEMKYVPYPGGGDVAASLAGKNSNSTVNNPGEQLGFQRAGKTRPIVTFTKARQPLFPNTPTLGETGRDFEYRMQRSVIGAPGMSKEAAFYYQSLMARVYTTPEWQRFMKKKGMTSGFLTGDLLMNFWLIERDTHRVMLKKMGMIK